MSRFLAIEELNAIKREFAAEIRGEFEHRAKSCAACETPGACCQDEHFVNVHISKLEANAIGELLRALPERKRSEISERVEAAIEKYGLAGQDDTFSRTFACPLYEKGVGCIVHGDTKPLPCIAHACYDRKEDLPPPELLADREAEVENLNQRVYGNGNVWLPIPLAIREVIKPF